MTPDPPSVNIPPCDIDPPELLGPILDRLIPRIIARGKPRLRLRVRAMFLSNGRVVLFRKFVPDAVAEGVGRG